jgi:hypothetical protein
VRMSMVLAAAVLSAMGGGCNSSAGKSTKPSLHVLSSITDGATLADAVEWTAHPVGLRGSQTVDRVEFLIDGRMRWSSRQSPYIFGLQGEPSGKRLFPQIVGAGTHRLTVRAVISGGQTVTSSARIRVVVSAPAPSAVVGRFTRKVTPADIARTQRFRHEPPDEVLPTGTWVLHVARNGLISFDDPNGSGGNEAFTATPAGALTFQGPANWMSPPARQGSFCGVEPDGSWRWSAHGHVLVLTPNHDTCADRNALFGGTWKRR